MSDKRTIKFTGLVYCIIIAILILRAIPSISMLHNEISACNVEKLGMGLENLEMRLAFCKIIPGYIIIYTWLLYVCLRILL